MSFSFLIDSLWGEGAVWRERRQTNCGFERPIAREPVGTGKNVSSPLTSIFLLDGKRTRCSLQRQKSMKKGTRQTRDR